MFLLRLQTRRLAGLNSSEDLIGAEESSSLVVGEGRLQKFLRQIFHQVFLNSLFKQCCVYNFNHSVAGGGVFWC